MELPALKRKPHVAAASRILVGGISTSATLLIVAVLSARPAVPTQPVGATSAVTVPAPASRGPIAAGTDPDGPTPKAEPTPTGDAGADGSTTEPIANPPAARTKGATQPASDPTETPAAPAAPVPDTPSAPTPAAATPSAPPRPAQTTAAPPPAPAPTTAAPRTTAPPPPPPPVCSGSTC